MHDGGPRPGASTSLGRYALLAVGILVANAGLMEFLTVMGLPLLAAKILVEAVLVPISFAVQRRWVFHEEAPEPQPQNQPRAHRQLRSVETLEKTKPLHPVP